MSDNFLLCGLRQYLAMLVGSAALAACSFSTPTSDLQTIEAAPVVTVAQGQLAGSRAEGINVFRGIPYAAAPVGDLRWKAPRPAEPWSGIRDAADFGPSCIQPPVPPTSVYFDPPKASSEDCLSLNVWAPEDAEKAPVIVWIHGGSLRIGGSAQPMYDSAVYAERGIVFVSINYRLGVLGWLAHPELMAEDPSGLSGNYGLLDQIAALEWVRDNIAAFGGDPDNVTIMGESAGALSVTYLLISPPAEGLFDKAIIESTNTRNFPVLRKAVYGLPAAEEIGADLFGKLKLDSLAEARAADAQDLMDRATFAGGFVPQGTVDGAVIPTQLNEAFDSGAFAKVPVLAGFNSGEGRTYRAMQPAVPGSPADYEAAILARHKQDADEFLKLYPSGDVLESMLALARDNVFGWSTERIVRSATAAGQPAYLYVIDYCYPEMREKDLCAFHASEIPFVFGTAADESVYPPAWPKPSAADALPLSQTLVDYWSSFAATGRPVSETGPVWPAYGSAESFLRIDQSSEAGENAYPGMFEFHERHYTAQREKGEGWYLKLGLWADPAE
jgi:para-nitrobenzyl esterase